MKIDENTKVTLTFAQLKKLIKESLDNSDRSMKDWFEGDFRTRDFTPAEKKDFFQMFKADAVVSDKLYDKNLAYWCKVNKRELKDAAGNVVDLSKLG